MSNTTPDTVTLSGIVTESVVDGPGIRFVLFSQGCPHRCDGCHNPATHPFEGGTEYKHADIIKSIKQNPLLYGLTISGGEPFARAPEFAAFLKALRAVSNIEIAVYSGYSFEEILKLGKDEKLLLSLCDILIDGRFEKGKKSLDLKFKGSKNQRIIDVKKSLSQNKIVLETSERWN